MASSYSAQIAENLDIQRNLSAIEIAWLAGLYEGEGHVSGIEGRTIAHISQKDPEILYRVREMLGGSITMVRMGTPLYCHAWKLYGDRARRFLQMIYPHLTTRRKAQIEKANGLKIVGKLQPSRDKMSAERKALRANMTPRERELESYRNHRQKNLERVRATQRAYQARKRAGIQVSEMIQ